PTAPSRLSTYQPLAPTKKPTLRSRNRRLRAQLLDESSMSLANLFPVLPCPLPRGGRQTRGAPQRTTKATSRLRVWTQAFIVFSPVGRHTFRKRQGHLIRLNDSLFTGPAIPSQSN